MSHVIPFDTIAFAKELEGIGVPSEQAEKHAQLMARTFAESAVTKTDLDDFKTSIDQKLKNLELRMTIKFGLMQVATIGILATLMKLF